jgi:phage shock protein PspC (stress-responsive transcriptional regulator)
MRKVTTINLNNNAYQIDEDGYEALRRYLEDAERALASNPDRAEIMADLEQAIADKCRLMLGQYKTVVSAAEIERILKEMGPVVASTADAAADSTPGAAGTAPSSAPRPRRLFRIQEGKFWTGVCNGLAAWAGVDVVWVRLAFVLLTIFSSGFWLIVYVVLIFVMPVAETPEELAAAHGHPFSAQELVDRVKQKHEQFRADRAERRSRRANRRQGHWFAAEPVAPASMPPRPPGPASRVAGNLMLPVFTVLSAAWFVVVAVAAFMVWHSYQHTGFFWPHQHWYAGNVPLWVPLVTVLVVYALLALPIGAGRRAAVYYANGGRHYGWAAAWSGLLWIALVVLLLAAAWTVIPQLQDMLRDTFGWPERLAWVASWI